MSSRRPSQSHSNAGEKRASGEDWEDQGSSHKRAALGDHSAAPRPNSSEGHSTSTSSSSSLSSSSSSSAAQQHNPEGSGEGGTFLRAIISTKMVGAVIGRAGATVKQIREDTGTKITISEAVPGSNERILTISGGLEGVASAYAQIHGKIEEANQDNPSQPGEGRLVLKILIPNSQAGSIIGKGGAKIKETQEITGVKMVLSEEQLPNSTERSMTLTGVGQGIEDAVLVVLNQMAANPDKGQPIPYRPSRPAFNAGIPAPGYPPQYIPEPPHYPPAAVYNPPPHFPPVAPAPVTQQLYIPNELVGSVIGKAGSKINEIRQQSGSQIRIHDPEPASSERLVSIIGTPESNQTALFLLYNRLQTERNRLATGQT